MIERRLLMVHGVFGVYVLLALATPLVASSADVVSLRGGGKLRVGNDRVTVVLDEADGTWDATWVSNEPAAVRHVTRLLRSPSNSMAIMVSATRQIGRVLAITALPGTNAAPDRRARTVRRCKGGKSGMTAILHKAADE